MLTDEGLAEIRERNEERLNAGIPICPQCGRDSTDTATKPAFCPRCSYSLDPPASWLDIYALLAEVERLRAIIGRFSEGRILLDSTQTADETTYISVKVTPITLAELRKTGDTNAKAQNKDDENC